MLLQPWLCQGTHCPEGRFLVARWLIDLSAILPPKVLNPFMALPLHYCPSLPIHTYIPHAFYSISHQPARPLQPLAHQKEVTENWDPKWEAREKRPQSKLWNLRTPSCYVVLIHPQPHRERSLVPVLCARYCAQKGETDSWPQGGHGLPVSGYFFPFQIRPDFGKFYLWRVFPAGTVIPPVLSIHIDQ